MLLVENKQLNNGNKCEKSKTTNINFLSQYERTSGRRDKSHSTIVTSFRSVNDKLFSQYPMYLELIHLRQFLLNSHK